MFTVQSTVLRATWFNTCLASGVKASTVVLERVPLDVFGDQVRASAYALHPSLKDCVNIAASFCMSIHVNTLYHP